MCLPQACLPRIEVPYGYRAKADMCSALLVVCSDNTTASEALAAVLTCAVLVLHSSATTFMMASAWVLQYAAHTHCCKASFRLLMLHHASIRTL